MIAALLWAQAGTTIRQKVKYPFELFKACFRWMSLSKQEKQLISHPGSWSFCAPCTAEQLSEEWRQYRLTLHLYGFSTQNNASASKLLKTIFQSSFPNEMMNKGSQEDNDQERNKGEGFDLFLFPLLFPLVTTKTFLFLYFQKCSI